MPNLTFALDDLRRILRESAGTSDGVDLDGEILDVAFEELGYDSLALMETATRITREFGVPIGDDAVTTASTPRHLLGLVNAG
jgi:act minimal PKS acyl carrier protein